MLHTGDIIAGRYRLEELIGEGAYGSVWRATQLNVARPVAVKFLKAFVADPSAKARFDREAKALARLQHPNCLTLLDFGHDGGAFLVTEYVAGERLDEWVRDRPTFDDILVVTRQILEALSYAHAQKIVHRDLKPPNIIITRDFDQRLSVKVLDFGIASVVGARRGDITKTGEVFGTPGYMSPEQLLGETNVGPTADLYSVGVMLYQMIEGHRLFEGKLGIEIALKHLSNEAPPLTVEVPAGVAEVVARLLKKHPADRLQSARDVLRALPEPPPTSAPLGIMPPPGPWTQDPPQAPPSTEDVSQVPATTEEVAQSPGRLPLAALGVVVVVVALAAVAAVMLRGSEEPATAPPPRSRALSQFIKQGAEPPTPVPEAQAPDVGQAQHHAGSAGCGKTFPARGLKTLRAMVGILDSRSTTAWVPRGYDPNVPHPVVMFFHDVSQHPAELITEMDVQALADRDGMIIVAPHHDTIIYPWDSEASWAEARADLDVAADVLCVDRAEIYLFGYGAGGHAAEQLACRIPSVRAVAVAAHRLPDHGRVCRHRDTPYLFMAPMSDGRDPASGGSGCLAGEEIVSVDEHERVYAEIQGCDPKTRRSEGGRYTDGKCVTWDCTSRFVSCRIDGGRPLPGTKHRISDCEGRASRFPYRDKLWDFFAEVRAGVPDR